MPADLDVAMARHAADCRRAAVARLRAAAVNLEQAAAELTVAQEDDLAAQARRVQTEVYQVTRGVRR